MQSAWQPLPDSASVVHGSPSSQLAGQLPGCGGGMPTSHVSPVSRTPSPQADRQSGSRALEAPAGQQPSPAMGAVIAVRKQMAEQVSADNSCATAQGPSALHASLVGHAPGVPAAMAVSQVSPGSTRPL